VADPIGAFVRDVDGKHWLICYVLYDFVRGSKSLIGFRDGKRKTLPASKVAVIG
jgi:hypothetical protein